MAEGHKKSFMLYFDNYPSIAALPADQRGELLVLLYRYAMAAEEGSADPEEFADQFPHIPIHSVKADGGAAVVLPDAFLRVEHILVHTPVPEAPAP